MNNRHALKMLNLRMEALLEEKQVIESSIREVKKKDNDLRRIDISKARELIQNVMNEMIQDVEFRFISGKHGAFRLKSTCALSNEVGSPLDLQMQFFLLFQY